MRQETGLTATATYADVTPRINFHFGSPEAFKVSEEFSDAPYSEDSSDGAHGRVRLGSTVAFLGNRKLAMGPSRSRAEWSSRRQALPALCNPQFDMILHVMFTEPPNVQIAASPNVGLPPF